MADWTGPATRLWDRYYLNVGWLGLLSVARLGGQRALGCGAAIITQLRLPCLACQDLCFPA
ncbi:hypothetical protein DCAR_0933477 [Daucus carota subsp. sativus]|uniref:Uncharacterized protein n=1 Tax=Daucus carota subsp. sativus TaxID=79200 RepID=A0AAF0XTI3_DAUCS|nr:hypothetical protein DCAR_0933477 [Daucus carota subsp. sativus]